MALWVIITQSLKKKVVVFNLSTLPLRRLLNIFHICSICMLYIYKCIHTLIVKMKYFGKDKI